MKNLAKLRKDAGMSQFELAERLGVSQQTISKYEKGTRQPDNATLLKLSEIFNCSVDYLLGRTDDPSPRDETSTVSDLEELLKQDTLMFDGEPLDEEAKEGILRFLKLVKETSEKRRKDQNKKSDSD